MTTTAPSASVIAVLGDVGAGEGSADEQALGDAGRGIGHADQPAVQADLARVAPEDTVIEVLGAKIGDGRPDDHGRAVLDREPRDDARDGPRGRGGRRDDPARRRIQAAHQPVRLPGPGRRGARVPGRGRRGDRPADDHRGDGAEPGGGRGQARRHPPDRHAQHAELLAADRGRQGGPAGHAQARLRRHHRGVADGRRVHRLRRATRT